eukprot:3931633-Rhodomonas_salina.1
MIQTKINEIKSHVDDRVSAIQQTLTRELGDKLLQIATNHNTGLEAQKKALNDIRATLEDYKTQIENNTQKVKTEMTQIIQSEMNKHVAELKHQLQTVATAKAHTTHPPSTPIGNRLADIRIQELDQKIDLLQGTIRGIIENATEARSKVQLTISSRGCLPADLIQGLSAEIKVIDEWVGPHIAWITDAVG